MKNTTLLRLSAAVLTGGLVVACDTLSESPVQPETLASSRAGVSGRSLPDSSRIVPGQYIVRFRDDVADPAQMARRLVQDSAGTLRHTYTDAIKGFAAQLPPHAVEALKRNPKVLSISPDVVGTENGSPQTNAPWGLDRIDQSGGSLNGTYYYDNTGAGVDIYILDSGISQNHPEFTGRIKKWHETISNSSSVEDCRGHGSSVASIAAGTSYGAAKRAWIIPVRINDCDGQITLSDAIAGIDWVKSDHTSNPAVANMSFSFPDYYYGEENLEDAVRALVADGVTVTVSAGNGDFYLDPTGYTENGDDACGQSPADVWQVITVSATDRNDRRPGWANYGSCVDIFAPGSEILSATKDGGSAYWSGTSMAAPFVAGVAALYLEQYPRAAPSEVWNALLGSSYSGRVSNTRGSSNQMLYSRVPGPPRAGIWGPERVHPMDQCEWSARVQAGAPPFRYQWQGIGSGTGSTIHFTPAASGYLYLYVTDAKNRVSEARIYVTMTDEQLPGCY